MKIQNQELIGTAPKRVVPLLKTRTALTFYNAHPTAVLYYGSDNQINTGNAMPIHPQSTEYLNKGLGDRCDLEFYFVSDTEDTDLRWTEMETPEAE